MPILRSATGLVLRLAVTLGLLGVLLFVVADPLEIGTLLADAALLPLAAAVALSALDRFTMAYKWWLLLRARRLSVSLWIAVRSYFASSLYGLVLPVTVGADAVRIPRAEACRHARRDGVDRRRTRARRHRDGIRCVAELRAAGDDRDGLRGAIPHHLARRRPLCERRVVHRFVARGGSRGDELGQRAAKVRQAAAAYGTYRRTPACSPCSTASRSSRACSRP